jgi:hypothetical protein
MDDGKGGTLSTVSRAKSGSRYTIRAESFIRGVDRVFVVHVRTMFLKRSETITPEDRFDAGCDFETAVEKHLDRGQQLGAEKYLLLRNDGCGELKVSTGKFAERSVKRRSAEDELSLAIRKASRRRR